MQGVWEYEEDHLWPSCESGLYGYEMGFRECSGPMLVVQLQGEVGFYLVGRLDRGEVPGEVGALESPCPYGNQNRQPGRDC